MYNELLELNFFIYSKVTTFFYRISSFSFPGQCSPGSDKKKEFCIKGYFAALYHYSVGSVCKWTMFTGSSGRVLLENPGNTGCRSDAQQLLDANSEVESSKDHIPGTNCHNCICLNLNWYILRVRSVSDNPLCSSPLCHVHCVSKLLVTVLIAFTPTLE